MNRSSYFRAICSWAYAAAKSFSGNLQSSGNGVGSRKSRPGAGLRGATAVLAVILVPQLSSAAAVLTVSPEPVTWNIIGLDHNNPVDMGPQDFPVGIRVKNNGDADATNVSAFFEFTSTNSFISRLDSDTVTTSVIPAGGFADFYFTVRVERNAAALGTMRDYRITVRDDGVPVDVENDTLHVEGLVSQQANDVLSLVGPPVIQAGEVRTFILTCETQTNREQLVTFVNFPNHLFQVLEIQNTFSAPGQTIDKFYVDACGWVRNNLPPDNNSCDGPDQFGGTVGGAVSTVYKVLVTQTPSSTINLSALILDKGGNAYHYNSDFGDNILPVNPPADLFVVKTAVDNPVEAGNTVEYLLSVVNPDPDTVAEDVVLSDTLPAGLTYVSASPLPTSGPNPLLWNLGDIPASTTVTVSLIAQTNCSSTGSLTNYAFASSTTNDDNLDNNSTSQTIVVQDTTLPTITCPGDLVFNADAGKCERSDVQFTVSAFDSCGTFTVVSVPAPGSTFPVGTTTVTSTATDAAGNIAQCTFDITILDVQAPTIGCQPTLDLEADSDSCSRANVPIVEPTVSDNCTTEPVEITNERSDGKALNEPFPVGTTIITWTATDASGLTATCNQQVIIRDKTAPVVECPANITVSATQGQCGSENVGFDIMANDNCGPVTIVADPPAGSMFPVGTTTVDVTVTDSAGNVAECSFTVTVNDTQNPTITCPPTINVSADAAACAAAGVTITEPEVADNCAVASIMGTRNDSLGLDQPYPVGTTTITWKVTDGSNNMATCMQQVIVTDTTDPMITCPATIDVEADPLVCEKADVVITQPTATDNCTNVTINGTRSDGKGLNEPYPVGVTTITWTATDGSNNTTECQQTVIVRDTTPPSLTCPATLNVEADSDACGASEVNIVAPTVTADNCSTAPVVVTGTRDDNLALDADYPVGTTTITWKATDAAGNMTTCTQLVTVADTTLPGITCPPTINVSVAAEGCEASNVTITEPTITDNCLDPTVAGVRDDGKMLNEPYPLGTTTITWTVTDNSGNTAKCDQLVIVADLTLPTITCPLTIDVEADPLTCSQDNVTIMQPTTSDNCSVATVEGERSDMLALDAPYPVGTTIITWTVTDGSGNRAECTQSVIVRDVTPPSVTCPATIDVMADALACAAANANVTPPTITNDNCSVATIAGERSDSLALDAPYPVGTTVITWTVTDEAGNMATCLQNVIVRDTTPPGIVCPPTVNVEAAAEGCTAEGVTITPPVTTDNCTTEPIVAVGERDDMLPITDPYPVGETLIVWTVTDSAGNQTSCTQQVFVADVTDPTITCPPTLTVNASAETCTAANVNITEPPTSDNCTVQTINGVRSDLLALNAPYPLGTTTITWTVTDASGNSASCTQDVVVIDVTAPSITCPQTITLGNTPGMCGAVVTFNITTSDACGNSGVIVVANPPSGSTFPVGTTTVNVTATDAAGNSSTCSFDVTITDIEDPTIVCPLPVMTCMQDVVLSSPLTADNCSTVSLVPTRSDNLSMDADYPVGLTIVTWTVTDASGNTAICTQNVLISDSVLPQIICPADLTIPALAGQCVSGPVDYPEPAVMDNCSTDTTGLTITFDPPEGSTFQLGENIVTVTVTDGMQNSASCTFKVIVEDVTAPAITCPDNMVISNTSGQCGAAQVTFDLTATDSCSLPVNIVANPPSGSTFPVGTTTVNVTATDAAGNMATCSFTVTVNDTQPPTISCPPTIDIMADAQQCQAAIVDLGLPITADNCSTASVTPVRSDGQPLSAPYPVGTTTVTWTVIDSAGNMATCVQQVIVRDSMMPNITCPSNITVDALEGQCLSGPVEYGTAIVSDNCSTGSEGLTVVFTPPSGSTFPVGMSTVTVTVTDRGGNQATCSFTVTVRDVSPPQITCPANMVVTNTPGQCGAAQVDFQLLATDACSGPVVVVANPPSGSMFPVGTTTVNVTATDTANNSATCSFTVTVNDTELPTITCPPTVDVTADAGQCQAANVNLGTPTTADNCTVASVTPSRSDGQPLSAPYPVGTTTVTWTVTDSAGNTATCPQQVIVRDTMIPNITCQADMTVSALEGQCISGPVEYSLPVVSDNCTGPQQLTVTFNPPQGSTFPIGTNPVTVTVTDTSGNQATCTFNVIVSDVTPPLLTCPANITQSNTADQCGATQVTFDILATDSCSGPVSIVAEPSSGSTFPVGTTTVNVTATDAANNVARCSFTVTINDTQPPTIECPPVVDIVADADQCQAVSVNLGLPITADNCSTVSVSAVRSDGQAIDAPYPVGTTTVTWTVTDSANNIATCTQSVTVRDAMIPSITCPGDITVAAASGQCISDPVQYPNPVVSDNCSSGENLTITFNPPQGSTFPIGSTPVTVTVTDAAGNQATCTFNVIVNDVTPPQIACPANIVMASEDGQCGHANIEYMVFATDTCSNPVTVVTDPPAGSTFPVGTTTVNATATDAAGNQATCSFTVTIVDMTAPVLTCPEPMVVSTAAGECQALNVTYTAQATDNCEGPVVITFNPPSGSSFPVGVNLVQVTASDTMGNMATCSFTVTVQDQDAPRIQCLPDILTATVPCEPDAVVTLVEPQVTDACGTILESVSDFGTLNNGNGRGAVGIVGRRSDNRPINDRFPPGRTTITWTATDASGNTSTCIQGVTVEESQCQPICDGPDLIIMTKMAPTFKCGGKVPKCKVKGWYIIANIGTQTSGETSVCFYVSDDEVLDASDFQFKQNKKKYRVKSLRPGEMVGVDLKGKTPKGLTVDGKFILGVVDCPGVVVECREDNNVTASHPMPK